MNLRCELETIELTEVERLLNDAPQEGLGKYFTEDELREAGTGSDRSARLGARYAAKIACRRLLQSRASSDLPGFTDFVIRRGTGDIFQVQVKPPAQERMSSQGVTGIKLSLHRYSTSVSAIAVAEPVEVEAPWYGVLSFYLLPIRRKIVLTNLNRVFGGLISDDSMRRLAQAYYGHFLRLLIEFVTMPLMSAERRASIIRVENKEAPIQAHGLGKGLLIVTGHIGNWEVATVAGLSQFPQYRNLFHVLRRALKPRWLDDMVTNRFRRSGLGTLPKRGSLGKILDLMREGGIIVFPYDQHAGGRDGIPVEFMGEPAGTFKSMAIMALATGAPVLPAACWREPDGTHVLRFEEPIHPEDCEDTKEAIRRNTRAYNAALERMILRHPEQWFWMHRRWKLAPRKLPVE